MTSAAPYRIRPATLADAPALRSLIELSVRTLQQHDYTPAQIEGALGHTLGLDTQLIADGTYFLAEAIAPSTLPNLAACGGWSFRGTLFGSDNGPGREAALLDPATEPARIRAIFVHPSHARCGLGSLLLSHCEQQAQLAGFTHFSMGSTLTGVPLYQLRGYRPLETVHVPLPNGEALPVVHMVKP
ncbi:MAG: GNAT family N-acetyltransferase [Acidobacteriota bacterium]